MGREVKAQSVGVGSDAAWCYHASPMKLTPHGMIPPVKAVIDSVRAASLQHALRTIAHLERASEHLQGSPLRSEDAVVQVRNAFQQVLLDLSDQVAAFRREAIPCRQSKPHLVERIAYLAKSGIILPTETKLLNGVWEWLSDRSAHPGFLSDMENLHKVAMGLRALHRLADVATSGSKLLAPVSGDADLRDLLRLLARGIIDPVRLRDGDRLPFARCPRCESDRLERGVVDADDDAWEYLKCECGWNLDEHDAGRAW